MIDDVYFLSGPRGGGRGGSNNPRGNRGNRQ